MNVNTYIKRLFRLGFSIDDVIHNVKKLRNADDIDDVRSYVRNMYNECKNELLQDMLFTHNIFKFKDIRFLLKDYYIIDDSTDAELKQALKDLN